MRRFLVTAILFLVSLRAFAAQPTLYDAWDSFSEAMDAIPDCADATETNIAAPDAPLASERSADESISIRAAYTAALDALIADLNGALASPAAQYSRQQNLTLFSVTEQMRDIAEAARIQIANGAFTEQDFRTIMQTSAAEMQSLVLQSLRAEYDISRSAGFLYLVLIVTLSALSVALALFVWLYLRRRRRIEELEQAVQNERLITQTIARVQENERTRIYRDLHDTAAQDIKATQLFANQLSELPNQTDAMRELTAKIADLAESGLQSIFAAIRNLTPPEVDGDFPRSIRELCQNVTGISHIPCKNFIKPDITQKLNELDATSKLHVYRIIQEALNNAVKHSRPTECSLIVTGTEKAIDIFVTDDGTGFDPADETLTQSSFGIAGMKSRAEAIGAVLKIDSTTESGTQIRLSIPIQNDGEGVRIDGED